MWFDVEEGDQLRQSDLEVPLGLGCLVLLGLEAVHSCLRYVKHWVPTGQIIAQTAGALLAASKRLGQTCPHPMPYCTVRIVLLWDVRVVICALRCRQNFTTIVVSVEATTIVSNNVAVDLNNNWASYRYTKVNLKEMKMLISVKTAPKFCLLKVTFWNSATLRVWILSFVSPETFLGIFHRGLCFTLDCSFEQCFTSLSFFNVFFSGQR